LGLARLAQAAGSVVVGIGTVVEKSFEGGRAALEHLNVPIESLATVTDMRTARLFWLIMDSIAILDFGSQFSATDRARVREAHIYSELFPWTPTRLPVLATKPAKLSSFRAAPTAV